MISWAIWEEFRRRESEGEKEEKREERQGKTGREKIKKRKKKKATPRKTLKKASYFKKSISFIREKLLKYYSVTVSRDVISCQQNVHFLQPTFVYLFMFHFPVENQLPICLQLAAASPASCFFLFLKILLLLLLYLYNIYAHLYLFQRKKKRTNFSLWDSVPSISRLYIIYSFPFSFRIWMLICHDFPCFWYAFFLFFCFFFFYSFIINTTKSFTVLKILKQFCKFAYIIVFILVVSSLIFT